MLRVRKMLLLLKELGFAKQDLAIIMLLSSIFFFISVWNLGRMDIPLTTVKFQTSGDEGFYILLNSSERILSVNVLLKKTADRVRFATYTESPEEFVCEMKTGLDGCFYLPRIGKNTILKIELLFDNEDLAGDQAGGAQQFPAMTAYPDGRVDSKDLAFINDCLNSVEGGRGWNYMADINPDGSINGMDLEAVLNNLGKTGTYIKNLTGVTVRFDVGGEKTLDEKGFVQIPPDATRFTVLRDKQPIGAMVTFWELREFYLDGYYCWRSIHINAETNCIGFILGPSSGEIAEIIVVGMGNRIIPISSIKGIGITDDVLRNLIDEQDKVEYPPTYMSETYFDEIYFVRTAEEYLKLEEPYECVHPPLGKLIIATGIAVFGYNPLGWRIMGVIFATLMIPVMYFLSLRLFETRIAAFIASFLWVFEFMHFTMGRIGTVDTYVVFFSLLSHFFFFTYLKNALKNRVDNRLLFFATIFFSLGFSTKWTVLFGFIGDVLLLTGFRFKELMKNQVKWSFRIDELIRYPISPLFYFLTIGIIVYFSTFIPYMMVGHSLLDVFGAQFEMYSYHATLEATHPFASPWWSWPMIRTPIWFYVSYLWNGMVSTITCMGNPAIWWFGTACLVFVIAKSVLKRDVASIYIVSIFFSQWLFYALISRCVFLYHFYPNVPFLVFAVTALLNDVWRSKKYGFFIITAYLTIVVAVFYLYYPVISGTPCPIAWKDSLRLFDSWIF